MKVYNTLTRQKEEFITLEKMKAKIYVCGPTVYNFIHIGNARPIVIFDTLRRYLLYRGYDVTFVSNFTDVDDKIIQKAAEEGVSCDVITERYIKAYEEDCKGLNIMDEHTIHPRATEYIQEMIDFVKGLEEKKAAYEINGNVYFDVDRAKDYGNLSKKNIENLISGARVDRNEEKHNPLDFVLWKKRKVAEEPAWDSPWGAGRPGWHIECSAMAKALLGDRIDLHAGGEDLQFPHHENEIAQSETLNEEPFAKYWMHNGMINVDNRKMSKSLGNFFLVREVAEHYDREVIRLWILSAHYRNPINFTEEVMEQTKNSLERLYTAQEYMKRLMAAAAQKGEVSETVTTALEVFRSDFIQSMDDDLNTAQAVSVIFELVRFINSSINEESNREDVEAALSMFKELTGVLGLIRDEEKETDQEIDDLIEQRNLARKNKDFQRADQIRDQLKERGVEIKDTPTGVVWKRRD